MKTRLVTFATPEFEPAQARLNRRALACGIDALIAWTPGRLRARPFFRENRAVLSQPRGAGYWLWKPYVVREALREAAPGDVVLYHDCGRGQGYSLCPVGPLVEQCLARGGILPGVVLPDVGPSRRWTKRDCFVLMGCDRAECWNAPPVSATWCFFEKTPAALEFVSRWLDHCRDARILTDQPNTCGLPDFPEFVDHRHDQSVLTNLVHDTRVAPLVVPHYRGHRIGDVLAGLGRPVAGERPADVHPRPHLPPVGPLRPAGQPVVGDRGRDRHCPAQRLPLRSPALGVRPLL